MLTRYACTAAELSCVIGNIFAELSPPCAACGAEVLQITGTTVTGNAATLTVTEAGFDFDGYVLPLHFFLHNMKPEIHNIPTKKNKSAFLRSACAFVPFHRHASE